MSENFCPCCKSHCNMNDLHCEKGQIFKETGIIPEKHHGKHLKIKYEELDKNGKLLRNFREIAHVIRHNSEGKGSQSRILSILKKNPSITQKQLTEHLDIQPGSVSEVLTKLENSQYIIRKQSEEDRRTTIIELTEKGKYQADEVLKKKLQLHEEMFACLSENEKENLLVLLEKINGDWKDKYNFGKKEHNHFHHHKKED